MGIMMIASIGGIWTVGMIGYIVIKTKSSTTSKKDKIVFFNVTDRVIKGKKFNESVNKRAKGTSFNVK